MAYARKRGYPVQRLFWWRKRLAETAVGNEANGVSLAPAVIMGANRASLVVSVDAGEVRVEVEDPGSVHPGWVAQLVVAVRDQGAQC